MERQIKKLVEEYGTPLYIFHTDIFRERMEMVAKALRGTRICYCVKANPFLLAEAPELVSRFEVCSYGEFLLCRYHKIEPERIFYTGVHKEETQIREAILYGVRYFSCESRSQLEMLNRAAESMGVELQVLLRLSSNNQFGIDQSDIMDIIVSRKEYALHFSGIHYFSLSQKRSASKIKDELDKLDKLCCELQREFGFLVDEIEYGLGLDSDYFNISPLDAEMKLLDEAAVVLREFSDKYHVTVEMGRFYAARCGHYITKVVDRKINHGMRYAIVDGGSHQMHYDGQMMGMKIPPVHILKGAEDRTEAESEKVGTQEWILCGSLCTHNDLIARKVPFHNLEIGDLLCFDYVGAYSVTEGMTLFLTRDIPPVILYSESKGAVCVRARRQTVILNGGYVDEG